jgi:hypothetical protein
MSFSETAMQIERCYRHLISKQSPENLVHRRLVIVAGKEAVGRKN